MSAHANTDKGRLCIREALDQGELADLEICQWLYRTEKTWTHDLAALVLDVLLRLVELVVGGILCEGDL